jgi:hypothetical protein
VEDRSASYSGIAARIAAVLTIREREAALRVCSGLGDADRTAHLLLHKRAFRRSAIRLLRAYCGAAPHRPFRSAASNASASVSASAAVS